ncbi:MAG: hypothetical protein KAZ63_03495 [Vitreoscilla sp.]|nr:hypothetical protein [Vitreoscilla sp.]
MSSSITSGTFKQASSSITCGGALVPSTLTRGGSSIATTPTVALPFGEACVLHVEVVAKSTDGGKDATTSVDVSFTTKAVLNYSERPGGHPNSPTHGHLKLPHPERALMRR